MPQPTPPKLISSANRRRTSGTLTALSHSLSRSWVVTPIAQASLERDIHATSADLAGDDNWSDSGDDDSSDGGADDDVDGDEPHAPMATSAPAGYADCSLVGSYRRPSFAGAGNRGTLAPTVSAREHLSREERQRAVEEERSLLRDNNLIPPRHPQQEDGEVSQHQRSGWGRILSIPRVDGTTVNGSRPTETSPLLVQPTQPYGGQGDPDMVRQKWEEAVREGRIQTTWQREAKTLLAYSLPLVATFLLQYSLTVASIFTVGHIGTAELGAVSLASMTANITGYAIYQGLATSLDTLCAQAYGSGRKKLVGLQMQRMVYFLWAITIPIAIIWLLADKILLALVPEHEVARLAGLYLKIVLFGAPGYALFESAKRYVQAQGLFSAALYVLVVCAPFNAFLNWFLVWHMGMGFAGAPVAVAITDNLLPIGLFIYVRFVSKKGMSCWPGFTRQALKNWVPMIKLALPGVVMVEAEVLAFEILTFASSYLGVEVLAAQSVVATLTSITFQIPFPLSIAASTRVANLIGATLADAAKLTTRVAFVGAVIIGIFNVILLSALKDYIPYLFTSDREVIAITSSILPLCAAFQLFDAVASLCNGTLRGIGRQHFGGYVQLFCYYIIAMPISLGTAFGLHWGLWGLWTGVALALGLVAAIELVYLSRVDWEQSVEEARIRNYSEA